MIISTTICVNDLVYQFFKVVDFALPFLLRLLTVLETSHVVVGAAIATAIPNPIISIPLALASHFVLDKVPHWNPHLNTELKKYGKVTKNSTRIVIADVLLSLILGFYIASLALPDTAHATTILLACFVSVLPDLVEVPYFFFNWRNELIIKWIAFQKSIQVDTTPLPGLLTQAITILAAFLWIR